MTITVDMKVIRTLIPWRQCRLGGELNLQSVSPWNTPVRFGGPIREGFAPSSAWCRSTGELVDGITSWDHFLTSILRCYPFMGS